MLLHKAPGCGAKSKVYLAVRIKTLVQNGSHQPRRPFPRFHPEEVLISLEAGCTRCVLLEGLLSPTCLFSPPGGGPRNRIWFMLVSGVRPGPSSHPVNASWMSWAPPHCLWARWRVPDVPHRKGEGGSTLSKDPDEKHHGVLGVNGAGPHLTSNQFPSLCVKLPGTSLYSPWVV